MKTEKTERVVEVVMEELESRGGFDHWWGGIERDVQEEILHALNGRVKKVFDD